MRPFLALSLHALLVMAALSTLPACPTAVDDDDRCERDTDCGDFNFCDPAGVCRCRSDDACDATEFCNLAGSCQGKLECFSDEDCRGDDATSAAICDTRLSIPPEDDITPDDGLRSRTAGSCVTLNSSSQQCLMDSHCPFGFFCQQLGGGGAICQPGCRDNGDCPLGQPCIANQCDATPGACNEVGYCEFGQTCDPGGLRCADHAEADILCQRCDPRDIFNNPCPSQCLIDTSVVPNACDSDADCPGDLCVPSQCLTDDECPAGATCDGAFPDFGFPGQCSKGQCADFFCGSSSCSETDPCPRGYDCNVLIAVSGSSCTPGSGTAQCGGGESTCLGGGENEEQGFCSCTSDADCPQGTCSNPGSSGVCIIGATCAPQSGLQCVDVLP